MSSTLVIQSHRQPLPYTWLEICINSVKYWAELNRFDYQFIGDELFNYVSDELIEKTLSQPVIATDLARLKLLQSKLDKSYQTVIWCDADFFIFAPEKFILSNDSYSLGREVWVQHDKNNQNRLTTKVKVHNAFMMYRKSNAFLDFYTDTAERLLTLNTGNMPPQFIGPKLLAAIDNIAQCHVLETAGMLSPSVIKDIASGGGEALALFNKKSKQRIAAANLCSSLFARDEVSHQEMTQCIQRLSEHIA